MVTRRMLHAAEIMVESCNFGMARTQNALRDGKASVIDASGLRKSGEVFIDDSQIVQNRGHF